MSITNCRECGEKVSTEADKCPSCGIKNPAMSKNVGSIIGNVIGTIFFIFIGLAVIGWLSESTPKASCQMTNKSLNEDVFIIDGEPDAGYRIDVAVKNVGEKGEIVVKAKLSTSEGEFERRQTLVFDSQETTNLSFNFHEPTINVENVQASLSCGP